MVSFSIRVNPKVRDEANALFESPGLDFATATRIFYQAAIDCGGFPFEACPAAAIVRNRRNKPL